MGSEPMAKTHVVLREVENIKGKEGSDILWDAEFLMGGKNKLTANMKALPRSNKRFMTQMCPVQPDPEMGQLGKKGRALKRAVMSKREERELKKLLRGKKEI